MRPKNDRAFGQPGPAFKCSAQSGHRACSGVGRAPVSISAINETLTSPGVFAGALCVQNSCPESASHRLQHQRVLRRCGGCRAATGGNERHDRHGPRFLCSIEGGRLAYGTRHLLFRPAPRRPLSGAGSGAWGRASSSSSPAPAEQVRAVRGVAASSAARALAGLWGGAAAFGQRADGARVGFPRVTDGAGSRGRGSAGYRASAARRAGVFIAFGACRVAVRRGRFRARVGR